MSGAPAPDRPRGVSRRTRLVIALWAGIAVVMWNGLYDVGISLGVRDYQVQAALHDAGRAPYTPMDEAMAQTVTDAALRATLWTALVLAAACATTWLLRE